MPSRKLSPNHSFFFFSSVALSLSLSLRRIVAPHSQRPVMRPSYVVVVVVVAAEIIIPAIVFGTVIHPLLVGPATTTPGFFL
jgi:hypothetical protein